MKPDLVDAVISDEVQVLVKLVFDKRKVSKLLHRAREHLLSLFVLLGAGEAKLVYHLLGLGLDLLSFAFEVEIDSLEIFLLLVEEEFVLLRH